MISGKDVYQVLAALVPLYVAMVLAYGSVRWWKIFTPDQCAGINRYVAVFAVPLLSFEFISNNNPYEMNFRFIAADSLQKVVMLVLLFLWLAIGKRGGIEWTITLFSLSTLPNTLVMGIPLLKAMYGGFTGALMVQIVVLQSVIWYTLLLILFEYRAAKVLISQQFPEIASGISSFRVDSDVISLGGQEPLEADSEVGEDGKIHVRIRRSNASSSLLSSINRSTRHGFDSIASMVTPRLSNLAGVEIYSVQSTPRASSLNRADSHDHRISSPAHGYRNSFHGRGSLDYSRQSSVGHMSRNSNFDDPDVFTLGKRGPSSPPPPPPNLLPSGRRRTEGGGGAIDKNNYNKELHMFMWSSSTGDSSVSDGNTSHGRVDNDITRSASAAGFTTVIDSSGIPLHQPETAVLTAMERHGRKKQEMPAASVMTKLILIMVWRKLTRNPNTYASVIGLVWSLISFRWNIKMPKIVKGSITILSDTGLGMAMFSLGLFMALQPKTIACGKSVALLAMFVRFLIGPAVVAATSVAIGIHGDLLHVSIVQAALPQGIVPFVFAKEYNVHADVLSTAVIFGMLVALPITIIYYILLGF